MIFHFFEGCVHCMLLRDPDPQMLEQNEPTEWFGHALLVTEINLRIRKFRLIKLSSSNAFKNKNHTSQYLSDSLFNRESTSATLLAGQLPSNSPNHAKKACCYHSHCAAIAHCGRPLSHLNENTTQCHLSSHHVDLAPGCQPIYCPISQYSWKSTDCSRIKIMSTTPEMAK